MGINLITAYDGIDEIKNASRAAAGPCCSNPLSYENPAGTAATHGGVASLIMLRAGHTMRVERSRGNHANRVGTNQPHHRRPGGNLAKHLQALEEARKQSADLVIFPEMSVLGYPLKDLLLKPAVIRLAAQAVGCIAAAARGITAIVGYPEEYAGVRGPAAAQCRGDGARWPDPRQALQKPSADVRCVRRIALF